MPKRKRRSAPHRWGGVAPDEMLEADFRILDARDHLRCAWHNEQNLLIQSVIGHAHEGHGMVATHDLKLAELEAAHPHVVRNYHFDIQVSEDEMLFDYKLKRGECTIFNASLLLRRIGVHVLDE